MRPLSNLRHAGAWCLCAVLAACGRAEGPSPDTSAAASVPLEVIESPGALVSRREAQDLFDAAREALVQKDFESGAVALSDAATFIQAEARTAGGDAKRALERSAEEIDLIAVRVAHGEIHAPDALDRVFANAHAAEAFYHLLRAHTAILKRDNVRAGEELVMSVDHLDRAAKDARLQADSLVQAAIADTRSLCGEMVKGMEAVPDEAARVTDEIERAIHRIAPGDALTDRRAAEAAPSAVPTVAEEPGALATRQEAQASFERARAALIGADYSASATHLANAAAFMRSHASDAEVRAIAAVQGAAKELDVLAERLARDEAQTTRTFDRVVANANRAEAQYHLERAVAAFAGTDHRRAGEELIIAVDHLERAAYDLGHLHDAEADPALSNARTLADLMLRGGVPARAQVKRVTGQLEAELRRLCAIIDVEARACAVDAPR
jgi:hypothetical protein